MPRIHLVDRQHISRRFAQRAGIVAVAGGDRFERSHVDALRPQLLREQRGEHSFADSGVGPGDKHDLRGHVPIRIADPRSKAKNSRMKITAPTVKITYYLEVISSWCHWVEPAWAELKRRYTGRVEFTWKIAQMPEAAYPQTKAQCEWFYRRSGTIMRSPYMLSADWFDPKTIQMIVPNLVAEAARDFGVTDDRVRLAIQLAAVREGKKVGRWEVALAVAAKAAKLNKSKLLTRAKSREVAARVRKTSTEFDALQVTQRPTFLIENSIGDRAVFSGIVRVEPLAAAIEAMLADAAAYASWKVHFGDPPPA
jgi:predicted DsbA family dithiol-disulfide isomerase